MFKRFFQFSTLEGVANWLIDIIATDYTTYSIEWSCVPSGTNSGCK